MANLVDSKRNMLKPLQIAAIAMKNMDIMVDDSAVQEAMAQYTKVKGVLPLRFGNTLFFTKLNRPHQGTMAFFNADTPANLVQNMANYVKQAYSAGFDFVTTSFDEPAYLAIFRALKANPPQQNFFIREGKRGDETVVAMQLGTVRGKVK